jgi:hypothetical protein
VIERIAILLLVNILFYLKTCGFKYISDDIVSAQRPKEKNKWIHAFWVFEGRLKSNPQADHFLTTVLHGLVCVGIYLGFGRNDISFIAALFFSFNSINNQGAVWISGRGYALSALGMVWALAVPWMAPLFLLGATYSNAGFLMPLVLVGSNHPYLLFFMPFIWAFHYRRFRKNVTDKIKMEVFAEDKKIHPKKLILATKTFGFYVSHSLIPIKTSFYHSLLESIAGSKAYRAYTLCRFFWIGVASISLMLWYVCFHKWDMISFGILWWCVGIAPFLNFYRMQQEIGERYAYLPNVGLMVILATLVHSNPYLVGGLIMMYATKTWFYVNCYKDDYWVVEYARMHSPDSWFAWHIAGMKRWEVGSQHEAMIMWAMAKILSPKEFKVLLNLATAVLGVGNIKEAEDFLSQAEQNIPGGQEKQCMEFVDAFKLYLKSQGKEGRMTILV